MTNSNDATHADKGRLAKPFVYEDGVLKICQTSCIDLPRGRTKLQSLCELFLRFVPFQRILCRGVPHPGGIQLLDRVLTHHLEPMPSIGTFLPCEIRE